MAGVAMAGATGGGAGAAADVRIRFGRPQLGQRTRLPASDSGARIGEWQTAQAKEMLRCAAAGEAGSAAGAGAGAAADGSTSSGGRGSLRRVGMRGPPFR